MTQTTARIKKQGKHFEIMVDMDAALAFKKGEGSAGSFLEIDSIFTDAKKGHVASSDDLKSCFGTTDVNQIAEEIVKKGEVLLTQEHRSEEREKRIKQLVDLIAQNAIDPQTGNPHTPERIKSALEQAQVNIKDGPLDAQLKGIVEELNKTLPLKIQTKKIKVTIPAIHTGRAYGIINPFKEKEEWLNDGSLEVIVNVPSGRIMEFYDKLNGVTQGSALTEEIKE